MSQKVLTFNMILSTSKSLIDSALATKSTTKLSEDSRFKNLKNFKFFTLNNNKSLISFEYVFSKQSGSIFKLEFLDYDGFFEYNLISNNINDYIVGYLNRGEIRKNTSLNLNPFSNFYIAFGVDADFTKWSGPFSVFLGKSEYEFTDENVKKILVTFFQIEGPAASRLAKIEKADNLYKSKFNTTPINSIIESNYLNIDSLKDLENKLFDNKIFPKLISDYIKAYTNQESIVLIPDMAQYRDYYESLKNSRAAARGKAKGIPINSELYELEAVDFFSEFGLNLQVTLRNPKKQEIKNTTISDQNNEKEEKRATQNKWDFVLTMKVTTPESQEARGGLFNELPDGYIPLQKIADGFSKLAKPKSASNYNLFEESDTKVLKIWKDLGLIKSDASPVIVWGRSDYIYNTLYSKLNSHNDNNDLYPELKGKLNSSYSLKLKNLYIQTYNSDFKETLGVNLNDFSLKGFRSFEINEGSVKSLGIPVFKSNVANPNVLSYDFSNFKQNTALLQSVIQSIVDNAIQDSASLVGSDVSTKSRVYQYKSTNIDKYLDSKLGGLYSKELVDSINKGMPDISSGKGPSPTRVDDPTIQKTYFDNTSKTYKSSVENYKKYMQYQAEKKKSARLKEYISKFVSNNFENPVQLQQKINNLMGNQVINLVVRTLPFFSLTGTKFVAFPCIFLQKLFNNFISPMTGVYSILGIKHIANTEEMYSEFELTKDGVGTNQVVKLPAFRPTNESGDISLDSDVESVAGDYTYEYDSTEEPAQYTYTTEESYTPTGGDTPVPDPCGEGGG